MTSQTYILLSGVLTYGVPVALAVRELLALYRTDRGGDELPPEEPFVPVPKPLPGCLLPVPSNVRAPMRVRVLEDA